MLSENKIGLAKSIDRSINSLREIVYDFTFSVGVIVFHLIDKSERKLTVTANSYCKKIWPEFKDQIGVFTQNEPESLKLAYQDILARMNQFDSIPDFSYGSAWFELYYYTRITLESNQNQPLYPAYFDIRELMKKYNKGIEH